MAVEMSETITKTRLDALDNQNESGVTVQPGNGKSSVPRTIPAFESLFCVAGLRNVTKTYQDHILICYVFQQHSNKVDNDNDHLFLQ